MSAIGEAMPREKASFEPIRDMSASRLSQRKKIVRPALKRDISVGVQAPDAQPASHSDDVAPPVTPRGFNG